jgi:hypothetical protein
MNEDGEQGEEAEAPEPKGKGKAKAKAKGKAKAEGGGRGRRAKKNEEAEGHDTAKGDDGKGAKLDKAETGTGEPHVVEAEKKPKRPRGKAKSKAEKPDVEPAVAPSQPEDLTDKDDEIDQVKTPVKRLFHAVSDDEEPEHADPFPPPPLPEGKAEGRRQRLKRLSVEIAPEPAKEFVKKTIDKPAPKRRYRKKAEVTSPSGSTQAILNSPAVKKEQVRRRRARKNQDDESSCVEDPLMKGIIKGHLKASELLPFDALQVYCREKIHAYKYNTCRLNPYFGRAASGVKYTGDPAGPEVIYYSFKNGAFNHRVVACYIASALTVSWLRDLGFATNK